MSIPPFISNALNQIWNASELNLDADLLSVLSIRTRGKHPRPSIHIKDMILSLTTINSFYTRLVSRGLETPLEQGVRPSSITLMLSKNCMVFMFSMAIAPYALAYLVPICDYQKSSNFQAHNWKYFNGDDTFCPLHAVRNSWFVKLIIISASFQSIRCMYHRYLLWVQRARVAHA